MSQLPFQRDVRHTDPDQTPHRRARFRDGWKNGAEGHEYTAETLQELTWENLGYRLGRLFGETSSDLVDQMYDWCVRQQRKQ
jgi:hypothetical protein